MKLMLIGGGEIGKGNSSYETLDIDKEIVKMCGRENTNVLFIGLASSFADSYYDYVKKIFKDLNCNPVYLKKKNVTKISLSTSFLILAIIAIYVLRLS